MTLACLYFWVSKTNRSTSAFYNLHVISFYKENCNGLLMETQDASEIVLFSCWNKPFSDLIIYKWPWYKSTGQINYPSKCSSTGLSGWVHAKQNNSDKNQETWRVRKTNGLWIFSQNKIKCSGQLSPRTPHIHPPVISFFLFCGYVARPLLPSLYRPFQ